MNKPVELLVMFVDMFVEWQVLECLAIICRSTGSMAGFELVPRNYHSLLTPYMFI